MENTNLEQQLMTAFRAAIRECEDIGYHPGYFINMLADEGARTTAIRLVMKDTVPAGYETLHRKGRLDLSVEAIILREPYNRLFPQEVLTKATSRLNEYGYTVR